MSLLIAQPRNGSEIRALIVAAHELSWEVMEAPTSWRLDDQIIDSCQKKIGVPYGSQIFCEVIVQQLNWKLKYNAFDWLAKLPFEAIKRQVDFMTLREAQKLDVTKFIKPADDKVFTAKIYRPGELITPEVVPLDETPVLVSEVVNFVTEYRSFVLNNKIQTTSCYLWHGEINEPKNWNNKLDEVNSFLQDLLDRKVIQSEAAVIDVGYLDSGDLAIIETNPAWASGIYGCDLVGVLNTLEKSCEIKKD